MGNTSRTHILLVILLVLVIVLLVVNQGSPWFSSSPKESEFDLVREAWQVIVNDYVNSDDIDLSKLSQGAIKGMIEALDDPYSAYFNVEQYKLSEYSLEGSFGGIGVEISYTSEGQLRIIAPIVGTPAYAAGIMPGDVIVAIDGEPTAGMDMVEAVMKVRGEIGEQVTLSILHAGEEIPEDYTITREKIELSSVISKMLADNIAHIEISYFSSRTGSEMVAALEDIAVNDVKGVILDLRNNPGGVLTSAVTVASQFLEEGAVTYVIYGDGHEEPWNVEEGGLVPDLPLAVLVNGNSASASEVVAGALQDHSRGIIIGNQTYGKGVVNQFAQLTDGSAIYITTARWFTPDKHQIEGEGITPDEIVNITQDDVIQGKDPQLERAIAYIDDQV